MGGDKSIPINVRVIAISNCPLEQMVAEGAFREDLYYRLNVLHIAVPPLRERTEDIPDLIRLFVQRCNLEMEKNVDQIDPKVYEYMQAQPGRAMSASSRTGWSGPWPPPGRTC